MKSTKIAAVLLAALMTFLPLNSFGASKTSTKKSSSKKVLVKKSTKKTVVVKKKSTVATNNETQTLYGIKGASLRPSKLSTKRYRYREKGKVHTTISKEASSLYSQVGVASYYGGKFHGRKTASGEVYNQNAYTAAHKTLAFGTYALVTNLRNGRKVIVKINDRGPFSKARIIDLSLAAAREIGMIQSGISKVRVEAMRVDNYGNLIGKGAESLRKLAQKEGGDSLAIKAGHSAKKAAKPTASTSAKKPSPNLTAVITTEQEAKKIVRSIKQKAYIEKVGKQYHVVIAVANLAESQQVKKQIVKLARYQSIHYSSK